MKELIGINISCQWLSSSVRSSCHRLNVGCVLVKDKHVISMGYNGFLPNAEHVQL